ncbi:LYR motif-containing protein 4 isoform X1 [Sus scrofa]|uniref:LYR motif-containing protein 4 isoform X1 n=1 Tax=Sus scrofa TaxID=9823 RepID=UPI000A2B5A24|nr:LYR motif-containing protein 4 isoform X1 [Sus scrofa]
MAASSRAQVLDLYRAMLRESKHFSAYNYRTYAIRRIRDAFRENKNVGDPAEIQALVTKAKRNLGIIRRQKCSCCLGNRDLVLLSQPFSVLPSGGIHCPPRTRGASSWDSLGSAFPADRRPLSRR